MVFEFIVIKVKVEDILVVYFLGYGVIYGNVEEVQFYYFIYGILSEDFSDIYIREFYVLFGEEIIKMINKVFVLKQVFMIDVCNLG